MNRWSLYLGKVAGIKLYIHWTFFLLVFWLVAENLRSGSNLQGTVYSVAFVLAVFICITLHELGHALMAKRFHYSTRDITLLPIGGMARMDELPENPAQELKVALAGPAVNIIIALLLFPLVYWVGSTPTYFTLFFHTGETFLFGLMAVNITLAVFNLVPAFPMDGGRVLRALLSMRMNRVKATAIAARSGQVIALVFFFTGLFYNPMLAVIGIFIFMMARMENEQVKSKSILQEYTVKDVMMQKYYSLDASDTVNDAVKGLLDVQATDFLVMEGGKVIGTLNRSRIIRALAEKGKDASILTAMDSKFSSLEPGMPLDEVLKKFREGDHGLLPVYHKGMLTGVVDMSNILELILVRTATEKNAGNVPGKRVAWKEEMV